MQIRKLKLEERVNLSLENTLNQFSTSIFLHKQDLENTHKPTDYHFSEDEY